MPNSKTLVYLFRRDLRVADNPILQSLVKEKAHGYTHLLPIYVFPAQQLEVSGFIPLGSEEKSPYPEARSRVGGFWRCGPHRAKFLAESVWDLKRGLEEVGSGLYIRVGMVGEVIDNILKSKELNVKGVWMTGEEGVEEKAEERDVKRACAAAGAECVIWVDEKYLIDEYVYFYRLSNYFRADFTAPTFHSKTRKSSQMSLLLTVK
jgi:deoxyribodipyrimidine photo-lyase